MDTLRFDLRKKCGKFKLLNATNGGPWHKRWLDSVSQISNLEAYKAARIPYSRNHDSGVYGTYGGPYSHDISKIFPRFEADPRDPASYDFACTDEDILTCLEAGTKTYFRLGETIEHQVKKHATLPPKDFKKWAVICEHIIRHYTEGWADGFRLDMPYWEIWNEADLKSEGEPNQTTWGGTKAQFFDLYEITAKHLKGCFPHLKIGGPALAWNEKWAAEFLGEMKVRNVPIDFFSWHNYRADPMIIMEKAERIKNLLIDNGYENAESHLNEWNYTAGWGMHLKTTARVVNSMKGAAFTMATISAAQNSSIDMLMYYSTIPHMWNGAFDIFTMEVQKGYYPLYWYGMFYDMAAEIKAENAIDNIYSLCGVDAAGKTLTVITYYTNEEDTAPTKTVAVDLGKTGKYEICLLDENHTNESLGITGELTFSMQPNSCILIKEI